MKPVCWIGLWFALSGALIPSSLQADITVRLDASESLPSPIGALLEWTAHADAPGDAALVYRFRTGRPGKPLRLVRDFGPSPELRWTSLEAGWHEVEVTVRAAASGEMVTASALYELLPLVTEGVPVLQPTAHPLVYIYSAPPCAAGARFAVVFQGEGRDARQTPWSACNGRDHLTVYLAGLVEDTVYRVQQRVEGPDGVELGPAFDLQIDPLDLGLAPYAVEKEGNPPSAADLIVQSALNQMPVATDLRGRLAWFLSTDLTVLTRVEAGGTFFGLREDSYGPPELQLVREVDLLGLTIRETNAARINEQLLAAGKRPITGFHHEARRLPDGRIVTLGATEQLLTDVQGPGEVNVIGDVILVLDDEMQLVWSWDALDHLDVRRRAILDEECTPGGGGCPPFFLTPQAKDWTHANSVAYTPEGNLLLSIRHQAWVVKIDYRDGAGSGAVLWRLGMGGDFVPLSADARPWFSHQHDAQLVDGDPSRLLLFDNSNIRRVADAGARSRGQIWRIDEAARRATLEWNADLGSYSFALGSAQTLDNGHRHFTSGIIDGTRSEFVEVDPSGAIVHVLGVQTQVYRGFRMPDLYSPPR